MTAALPVVDVCNVWYDRDCWRFFLQRLASVAPAYLWRFGDLMVDAFDADVTAFAREREVGSLERAVDVLVDGVAADGDPAAHLARMDDEGVVAEVIHGMPGTLPTGETVNERVAALSACSARVHAWAGITLRDPSAAVAEMRRCADAGMTGFALAPFYEGVSVRDERCAPLFDTAAELDLPVWIHSGANFRTDQPMDICAWRDFDDLAGRWPDLTLVAGHACWPWLREMMAVAQRHPRVYVELSTHRPRRMARPGSGFEPLLRYGSTTVKHQVLFGTGGPWVHPVGLDALAREVADLDIGDAARDAWLHGNAARLLGGAQPPTNGRRVSSRAEDGAARAEDGATRAEAGGTAWR